LQSKLQVNRNPWGKKVLATLAADFFPVNRFWLAEHCSDPLPEKRAEEDHRTMVTAQLGRAAANAHRVLEHLYKRPILGVADVQKLTGTTYTAANNLVSRLSNLAIIQETTGNRRNRLFSYEPYIRIFREPPPEGDDDNDRARETP